MIKNIVLLIILILIASKVSASEKREMIAVIDTGISFNQTTSGILCKDGRKSFVGDSGLDRNGHGRNIIGIIVKRMNIEKQCILSYKVWTNSTSGQDTIKNTVKAILHATARGAKFINISMGGPSSDKYELASIKRANRLGVYVIVAAGNGYASGPNKGIGKNFNKVECDYYPACYRKKYQHKKFRVVTSKYLKSSNRGDIVTDTQRGKNIKAGGRVRSGTSQSAAVLTSKLINL